jgi:anti-sigma-K factor RskA
MSVTIAQRPHVQVPWLPIIAVLAIAAAAALVLTLTLASSQTTPAATGVQALGAAGASVGTADVPRDKSPIVRAIVFGDMPAAAPAEAPAPLRKSSRTPWLAGGGASSSR